MRTSELESTGVRRSFVRAIAERTPLPAPVTVEDAASCVLGAVAERLTRGGAATLIHGLPRELVEVLSIDLERRQGPPSTLDRPALLDRAAARFGVTPAVAERICVAVLSVTREWLPPHAADSVTAQLPADLKALWLSSPEEFSGPTVSPSDAELARARLFASIERSGALPPHIDVADAFMAVMCVFARRLSAGEARHVLLGLPAVIRPLVTSCMLHRSEWAEPFGREALLGRIAEHLGTSVALAERITVAVVAAVRECLPERDVEDAASQLPFELRQLWMGH